MFSRIMFWMVWRLNLPIDLGSTSASFLYLFGIVIPSGVSPTPFFKDLGLRTYAYLFELITILFWILAWFFEGVVDAICLLIFYGVSNNCSRIFDMSYHFPNSQENRTKGAPVDANIGPGGSPPKGPKHMSQRKRATRRMVHANGSKMESKIWKFDVFGW